MSTVRPPLPPRRQPPPPPPRPPANPDMPRSIAARIASLQAERTKTASSAKPPPIPARPKETTADRKSVVAAEHVARAGEAVQLRKTRPSPIWIRLSAEELARALARRPPPPPKKFPDLDITPSFPPDLKASQRRLPPIPPPRPSDPEPFYQGPALDAITPGDESYAGLGSNSCPECRDFGHVDAHAALFPRHSVASLDTLAYDLTEPFPYQLEKARAIFTWLHYNIAYDTKAFFSENVQPSTAESTFSSGLAVCDGYAGLFKSLAERAGIQVHKVTGHGKGIGWAAIDPDQPTPPYSGNHAWNCAFLDGEWHLIDSCWGAGALDGSVYQQRFATMWFTSSPREFGRTHFPQDPSFQLISKDDGGPISWEEYIMEPAGPTVFHDFYKLDLWSTALQPSTQTIQGGTRVVFYVFKRCEHMSTNELDNYVYMISVGNVQVPLEVNAEGGWGADVYIPRGSGEVSLFYVTTVNGQNAKGIGVRTLRSALGRTEMSFGGLAKWTVV